MRHLESNGRSTSTADRRVYLTVPFREKDEAKVHGARWDPDLRLWWVNERVFALLPEVRRWMSPSEARRLAEVSAAGERPGPRRAASVITPRRDFSLVSCSCPALPWEHCEHTRQATLGEHAPLPVTEVGSQMTLQLEPSHAATA